MPNVQHAPKQIRLKLVYYGPGLGGKTTNLEHIHSRTRPPFRGKLIALHDEAERTLFFDLLPMSLGRYRDYAVHLHLCTVPGQVAHDATRRLVLHHVDGLVFVADSQPSRSQDNLQAMRDMLVNLERQGDDPERIPWVVQYNKRDVPGALPFGELRRMLDIRPDRAQIPACATQGMGVFETLKAITAHTLQTVGDPASAPAGRSPSLLPGKQPSMAPPATPEALSELSQRPSPAKGALFGPG